MDKGQVSTAMLSITAPGAHFGNAQEARRMARQLNDYGARQVSDRRGRFGLFAVLPLPDVEGSLREIEYVFDTLKADGVGLLTSYGPKYLGDPEFAPVFEELNRRRAVVYTHPNDAPCCQNLIPGVGPTTVEYNTDTSRAIASLVISGTADRTPNITYIFSHAGGTITALAGRFLGAEASAESLAGTPAANSRLFHLRRFYYDTAQSANPVSMQSLRMLVRTSQIVFGTDIPYGNAAALAESLKTCGFSQEELRAVDRENALKFLPRFRS
jgi:predicted TIM-barrel fold metal-dependent hydrolase